MRSAILFKIWKQSICYLTFGVFLFGAIRCESNKEDSVVLKEQSSMGKVSNASIPFKDTIGYSIQNGTEFFENQTIKLLLIKSNSGFNVSLKIDLGKSFNYPLIKHSGQKQLEKANQLAVFVHLNQGSNEAILSDTKLLYEGNTSFDFPITPNQLKEFRSGFQTIELRISSELVTFFGDLSSVYPLDAVIRFQFKVPPIYHSTFYFKGLKLNQKSVTEFLGENDRTNRLPEAGIYVTCNEQLVVTKYATNTFQLTEKIQKDFYHLSHADPLVLDIIDKDYLLNRDDCIDRIELPVSKLVSENYKNYASKYVDELWIKCNSHGIVNTRK